MNYFITEKERIQSRGQTADCALWRRNVGHCAKGRKHCANGGAGHREAVLGLCFGFWRDGSNDYMVGLAYETDLEGLESFTYPKASWVVYNLSGKISDDVLGNAWWYVKNQLLPELNYEVGAAAYDRKLY